MIKIVKITVVIAIVLFIIVAIVFGFIGNYFYNLALNPKVDKSIVFSSNENEDETEDTIQKKNWILDESGCNDVYIDSNDGIKLHGYEIKSKEDTNVWIISVHGYTSEGKLMSSYAENFNKMGYNVLVPDLRGHGKSLGDYIGMGWHDRIDLISWINYIIYLNPNAEIILHGVSMGGGTVMMTSGENLPSNVKCIIEDCGYTSAKEEFSYQLKKLFGLPEFPVINAASLVSKIRAGYWLGEASAVNQVKKSKVPMMFIHGDEDEFVPFYMQDIVYNAANVEKEKVVINGGEHANSHKVNPELYWKSVNNFINKYIID